MEFFLKLFNNYMLISAGAAWLVAQICKIFTGMISCGKKKINFVSLIFESGGMPSSHSACVSALAASAAIYYGMDSAEFAISIILALVVMRDASGVRREAGKQAELLNTLADEINSDVDIKLQEKIGHSPLQVIIGMAVGIMVAVMVYIITDSVGIVPLV